MILQEDVFKRPDQTIYCLHCDGSFKAREIVMKESHVCECPLWVKDRRSGELVKCNGGFWDLFDGPWWRDDFNCERCNGQWPHGCECPEGEGLLPEKYRQAD